jgi:hypothetical protein
VALEKGGVNCVVWYVEEDLSSAGLWVRVKAAVVAACIVRNASMVQ